MAAQQSALTSSVQSTQSESEYVVLAKATSGKREFFAGSIGFESGRPRVVWAGQESSGKVMSEFYARLYTLSLLQHHGVMCEILPTTSPCRRVGLKPVLS